ncbi:hypothetical protein Ancab_039031 [Ancistrocladus abbreviatus]
MGFNLEGVLPFVLMVIVECLDAGMTTISKAAMSKGMNHYVFVFYSNALATLLLLPSSFFFDRIERPPLTFSLLCKFFLLSFVGITMMQNCVFTGVNFSSPTLASAMSNLIPAFTFLLSVIFRMEKLELRSFRSQIKILGTLVSISGALIVTFYDGPSVIFHASSKKLSPVTFSNLGSWIFQSSGILGAASNWVVGGAFLAAAGLCLSIWNVSQAALLKGYPSGITIVFFYCLFGAIQTAVVSVIAERNLAAYQFTLGIELVAVIYSAVFGNVLSYNAETWCIHKKGPVFVAMFKPVGIAIASLMSVILLGETLRIGTILGAAVIVCGFYAVIWSQSNGEKGEEGNTNVAGESSFESAKSPLLYRDT